MTRFKNEITAMVDVIQIESVKEIIERRGRRDMVWMETRNDGQELVITKFDDPFFRRKATKMRHKDERA